MDPSNLNLSQITTAAVALFHHLQPWLPDKVSDKLGTAVITQTVREAWEQIKKRLPSAGAQEAIQKMEADPADPLNQQILNLQLQQAAKTDPALLGILTNLAASPEAQIALGDNNIQNKIVDSPGASIKISGR